MMKDEMFYPVRLIFSKRKAFNSIWECTKWAVLYALLVCILMVGCGGREADAETLVLAGELPLVLLDPATGEAAETFIVGRGFEALVGPVVAPNGTPVTLVVSSSYGSHLLRATFRDGFAWFDVLPELTTDAGSGTAVVTAGSASGAASLTLLPDVAVDPVIPFVGAKSIVADGAHYAMAVIIPFDQYGNLLPDGTVVNIKSSHPNGALRHYQPEVKHGFAWEEIYSTTTAGRTLVTATVHDAFGPEGAIIEIPGWPIPFDIFISPDNLPADGFHLLNIRSGIITDKNGNVMPDGTMIKYQMSDSDGSVREYPTVTLDGVAEVTVQTPRQPGVYQIRGTAFGMQTEPVTVEFLPGPALGEFAMALSFDTVDNAFLITAGPITGSLDQFVADGTEVQFTIRGANGVAWTAAALVDAGYATVPIRRSLLTRQTYRVEASVGAGYGELEFSIKK